VRLRSISRPLVELIQQRHLPAEVTVLRPPHFDQLRRHLREHPHTYHVLHFDGHGGYGDDHPDRPRHGGGHCFQARGVLVFEKPDGSPDPIDAEQLTNLLQEHAVPAVLLNACQSAMIDERAADPFASVAAALIKAGARSVVAMAYSL
jgi:CHAT domain-containing protein